MNPFILNMLSMMARQAATAIGAVLVARGFLRPDDVETLALGFVAIAVGVSSACYAIYKRKRELMSALAAPAGTTQRENAAILADPLQKTPPASLPKDAVPVITEKGPL